MDFIFLFYLEQIGGEIIEDLGDQRESLIRTRDRVRCFAKSLSQNWPQATTDLARLVMSSISWTRHNLNIQLS